MPITYTRKVIKVGKSYAVTIPKAEVERLGLKVGDYVLVTLEKLKNKPRITITALK